MSFYYQPSMIIPPVIDYGYAPAMQYQPYAMAAQQQFLANQGLQQQYAQNLNAVSQGMANTARTAQQSANQLSGAVGTPYAGSRGGGGGGGAAAAFAAAHPIWARQHPNEVPPGMATPSPPPPEVHANPPGPESPAFQPSETPAVGPGPEVPAVGPGPEVPAVGPGPEVGAVGPGPEVPPVGGGIGGTLDTGVAGGVGAGGSGSFTGNVTPPVTAAGGGGGAAPGGGITGALGGGLPPIPQPGVQNPAQSPAYLSSLEANFAAAHPIWARQHPGEMPPGFIPPIGANEPGRPAIGNITGGGPGVTGVGAGAPGTLHGGGSGQQAAPGGGLIGQGIGGPPTPPPTIGGTLDTGVVGGVGAQGSGSFTGNVPPPGSLLARQLSRGGSNVFQASNQAARQAQNPPAGWTTSPFAGRFGNFQAPGGGLTGGALMQHFNRFGVPTPLGPGPTPLPNGGFQTVPGPSGYYPPGTRPATGLPGSPFGGGGFGGPGATGTGGWFGPGSGGRRGR